VRGLGVTRLWEERLGLRAGELSQRMHDVWAGGSIGTITEDDVHQAITERLGLDGPPLAAFMADIWREYLGTAKHRADRPLRLRPTACRTPLQRPRQDMPPHTRAGQRSR
jgi:hypothetical protein